MPKIPWKLNEIANVKIVNFDSYLLKLYAMDTYLMNILDYIRNKKENELIIQHLSVYKRKIYELIENTPLNQSGLILQYIFERMGGFYYIVNYLKHQNLACNKKHDLIFNDIIPKIISLSLVSSCLNYSKKYKFRFIAFAKILDFDSNKFRHKFNNEIQDIFDSTKHKSLQFEQSISSSSSIISNADIQSYQSNNQLIGYYNEYVSKNRSNYGVWSHFSNKYGISNPNALKKKYYYLLHLSTNAGLRNLGNTCFVNAALQITYHSALRILLNRLQHGQNTYVNHQKKHFCIYQTLTKIFNEMKTNEAAVEPMKLIENMDSIYSDFEAGRMGDTAEFYGALISILSDSYTKIGNNSNDTNIIDHIFGIDVLSKLKCKECSNYNIVKQTEYTITFNVTQNRLSLQTLFALYQNEEPLEILYFCEHCMMKTKHTKKLSVSRLPLMIAIKIAFDYNNKSNQLKYSILENESLILSDSNNMRKTYGLKSILRFKRNHYYTFVRCERRGIFFEYNDNLITLRAANEILTGEPHQMYIYEDISSFNPALLLPSTFTTISNKCCPLNLISSKKAKSKQIVAGFLLRFRSKFGYFVPNCIDSLIMEFYFDKKNQSQKMKEIQNKKKSQIKRDEIFAQKLANELNYDSCNDLEAVDDDDDDDSYYEDELYEETDGNGDDDDDDDEYTPFTAPKQANNNKQNEDKFIKSQIKAIKEKLQNISNASKQQKIGILNGYKLDLLKQIIKYESNQIGSKQSKWSVTSKDMRKYGKQHSIKTLMEIFKY